MNAGPAHEAEHHGERRDHREDQSKPHWPAPHRGEGLVRSDPSWKPYQRQERVDGPDEAALRAGCKQAGQHRCSRAIEDVGIVEARCGVGKDANECHCATRETEPPKSDDGPSSHNVLSPVRLTDPFTQPTARTELRPARPSDACAVRRLARAPCDWVFMSWL